MPPRPVPNERAEQHRARREARRGDTRREVDITAARAEAELISNPARQKMMLEALDELARYRSRADGQPARRQQRRAQEDFIRANMARVVTDDLGRSWALAKALPDGSIVVDEAGDSWKYIAADRALTRLTDG